VPAAVSSVKIFISLWSISIMDVKTDKDLEQVRKPAISKHNQLNFREQKFTDKSLETSIEVFF
jgi:hypothetical protein